MGVLSPGKALTLAPKPLSEKTRAYIGVACGVTVLVGVGVVCICSVAVIVGSIVPVWFVAGLGLLVIAVLVAVGDS